MERYIDLHTHSIYSEGVLDCKKLVTLAKKHNIKVMALTDHNVIDGVTEITELAKKIGIKIIPGVEIYTNYNNKGLHLLGYNFRSGKSALSATMEKLQAGHRPQVLRSIKNLRSRGFIIDEERLFNSPSRYLGAVHLLREMENHPENVVKMAKELPAGQNHYFGKVYFYFGHGQPAYFANAELPTPEAIDIIKQSGGFSVLAHPGQQLTYEEDGVILKLIKEGLDGVEVLSPYHNWHQTEHYQVAAIKNNLLITGGSDYHADIDYTKKELVKRQWEYFKVPYNIYLDLTNRIKNLKKD